MAAEPKLSARFSVDNQWLQFDLGPPTTVTGVITRGQGDNRRRFVTAYTLSYSNDSSLWYVAGYNCTVGELTLDCPCRFFYKESNHLEAKVFAANLDSTTERRHYLNEPLTARFVRIHPVAWHRRIGMRAAVLGCPRRRGQSCGEGFMRVNDGAACGKGDLVLCHSDGHLTLSPDCSGQQGVQR